MLSGFTNPEHTFWNGKLVVILKQLERRYSLASGEDKIEYWVQFWGGNRKVISEWRMHAIGSQEVRDNQINEDDDYTRQMKLKKHIEHDEYLRQK